MKFEKQNTYLVSLLTNQNSIHEEMKCRHKVGNSYYYPFCTLLSSWIRI